MMNDERDITKGAIKAEVAEKFLRADLAQLVAFYASKTLWHQVIGLNGAESVIRRHGGIIRGSGAFESIMDKLVANYRRYGEKAHPASEKQLTAMWRELQNEYKTIMAINGEE